jgi:hypothetical protein
MQEENIYRQYAADCRRMAETMNAKDKAVLITMAAAWDARAQEAARKEKESQNKNS